MSRVSFYILGAPGPRSRQAFACRLAEKAYRLNRSVHIHAGTEDDAAVLDELLWTFRDGSFVPHELLRGATPAAAAPVTIGCGENCGESRDLLINLDDDIPDFAAAFERIAELVSSDDDCKQAGRQRFAAYRDAGHEIETHNV
jgi:DNA polymerase-3 subunit chi